MRNSLPIAKLVPAKHQGFTLVELLVAITLSMILMAVIGDVYIGSRQAARAMSALSRMQENARYIFDAMSNDLRMAGSAGCMNTTQRNALPRAATPDLNWWLNLFDRPLQGYDNGLITNISTGTSDAQRVLGTDALTVLRADESQDIRVTAHTPPNAAAGTSGTFTLNSAVSWPVGDILIATDCLHAAVFQASAVRSATSSSTVEYGTANLSADGTTSYPFPDVASGGVRPTRITRIYPLRAVTYYIGNNPAGNPALYVETFINNNTTPATVADELVEGVENMQIQYGEDTNGDGAVDFYRSTATGTTGVTDWANVLSIRVSLLLVSSAAEGNVLTKSQSAFTFNGGTITPTDRRMRRVFNTTITVRNRL